ncbi:hypothetical protein SAMN06295900_101240 [Trinickia caryophylli]|uniref:Uncharacterized protein n=1 Tax=Trinickia caryophylli TaxID=28094 RepID=A0A1X7CDL5_TRICW|nr:hypothetical protein SAMN06295900_101240 [Trinickia caryophylli]
MGGTQRGGGQGLKRGRAAAAQWAAVDAPAVGQAGSLPQ